MCKNGSQLNISAKQLSKVSPEIFDNMGIFQRVEEQKDNEMPFYCTEEARINAISCHFKEIIRILGLDTDDSNLKETPIHVASMYVKGLMGGLGARTKPDVELRSCVSGYRQMLVEKNINFFSCCAHHFLPIWGKMHLAYFSSGHTITRAGVCQVILYHSSRPQVQEKLMLDIADEFKSVLKTSDLALKMEAWHFDFLQGNRDFRYKRITSHYEGRFLREEIRKEFLSFL